MKYTKRLTVLIILALWCIVLLSYDERDHRLTYSISSQPVHAQKCSEDQYAANTIVVKKKAVSVPAAPVSSCPSGTYTFAWNGDHPTGSDYGCVGSTPAQASANTGAIGAGYGRTGNGFMLTSPDQYLQWTVTADDKIDDAVGTVWMWVHTPNGGALANNAIFEAYGSANDRLWNQIQSVECLRFYVRHNSTEDSVYPSTLTFAAETWTLVGISWRVGDEILDMAVTVNSDGDTTYWEAAETLEEDKSPTAFGTQISAVLLGERYSGAATTDEIWIDDVYILKTYKADYPGPT